MIIKRSGDARVVELADSLDSGSSVHYARAGSSPASRTKKTNSHTLVWLFCFFVRRLDLNPKDGGPAKA